MLEIQYENEVGTGLGPTLEFYALVSLELQKCDLEMWRGDRVQTSNQSESVFFSPCGLFPAPIGNKLNSKQQTFANKIKHRFKFLGKFFAKALMDFRVLDIQLSLTFYKWLIDPKCLSELDMKQVDEQLYNSLDSLKDYLRKRRELLICLLKGNKEQNIILKEMNELENSVSALDLEFTLPGYSHIELKKGGKDIIVSLENLEEYIKVFYGYLLIKLNQNK